MTNNQINVIVGASLAGAKAAETLRREDFNGRIVLIGAEQERVANTQHPFYGRRVRVERWANALDHGPVAAHTVLGPLEELAQIEMGGVV
jgi:NADPH-dependent 2,4-dienoyl-CoA reductase/sulfur reductase-like enzyme